LPQYDLNSETVKPTVIAKHKKIPWINVHDKYLSRVSFYPSIPNGKPHLSSGKTAI
jgi:hypothetical protein